VPFSFPNELLKEGMRAAVTCQILEGDLPVYFTWKKGPATVITTSSSPSSLSGAYQQEPGRDDRVSVRNQDEFSSTLAIRQIGSEHNGEYVCVAENAAGQRMHSANLTVNGEY
jgi:hypothetical protein